MNLSVTDLYPVVQDLTEAEYGCCSSEMVFGSFSLRDLANPNANAMQLSSSLRNGFRNEYPSPRIVVDRENSLIVKPKDRVRERECVDEITKRDHSHSRFEDNYVLTRQICSCRISTVWECVNRSTGVRHCVKVIDRRRFTSPRDEDATLNEMPMLSLLRECNTSPNIIQAQHISQDQHRFYIVTNLVEGGNLASYLLHERMPEDKVRVFAKSLLENVAELHSLGIGHFNLNPENILLRPDFQVSLCDFGNAAFVEDMVVCRSRQSKLAYASPEDVKKRPDLASDLWSVGVILYVCFCYHLPFRDSSRVKLKAKICRHSYDFSSRHWNLVSRIAKQFISSLLHPDPQIRLTAQEALDHPWLSPVMPNKRKPKVKRRRRVRLVEQVEHVWGRLKRHPQHDSNELKRTSTFSSSESG
mmetsp:Transcript_39709/g.95919  ORF Transcript_39709/g.95919 Transcript_39709/m.95919 type:complete len:415 (-) Transcript_39709:77-1321(-)